MTEITPEETLLMRKSSAIRALARKYANEKREGADALIRLPVMNHSMLSKVYQK